ncbi:hypothetical protein [Streptomyces sp. YIM S03343]
MENRTQHTVRGSRWTTHTAAFRTALLLVLAVMVMSLGYFSHGHGDPTTASMTAMSAPVVPADVPDGHHMAPVTHPADCPSQDVCCEPAAEGERAVLAAPIPPLPAVLPRPPDLPGPPDASSRAAPPLPTDPAPDLHVLQVQRT